MPSDTGKRLPVDFAGGAAGILLRPMVARASAADYDQQASTATESGWIMLCVSIKYFVYIFLCVNLSSLD